MQTYLNQTGVPLSVAVYLATDHYDHVPDAISATSLIKPVRQQILPGRVPAEQAKADVLSFVKSRIGTSIHDGLERVWVGGHYKEAMLALGYPQKIIDRVVVNPVGKLPEGAIPVYMEIRSFREINGVRISGKFDFVAEGRLEDFKSTSTFTWVKETKVEDYKLQGSIYRWLNPGIITQDHMAIQFFFTDWMPGRAKQDPKYPQRQVEQQLIPLLSLDETERYIRNKLAQYDKYRDAAEQEIPECTDEDLWRREPSYKYYKNPAKRLRSTKNFETLAEANKRLAEDGNVGVVVTVPGEVVACRFCAAFPICTQKDKYIADGTLNV
jgi:hypothetical protein